MTLHIKQSANGRYQLISSAHNVILADGSIHKCKRSVMYSAYDLDAVKDVARSIK